jgi:hypothetical protein
MRVSGFQNVPGAPGNTYGNLAGNPFGAGLVIPKGKASGQPVMPGENPADINSVYGRPGLRPMPTPMQPKLPMAFGGDNFNLNTLLAQVSPGGQNIGNVGGMMQPPQEFTPMANFEGYGPPQPMGPSPEQLKALQTYDAAKQQKETQNAALLQQGIQARNEMLEKSPTSSKPLYLDINAVPTGLESVGAGAKMDLGRNQNLNFGGVFTPGYTEQGVQIPQGYTLKAGYGTPSLDVNVNYREGRRGLGPQQGGGFGAEAMYNTRF